MDNAYQVDADFIVIDFETATRSNDSACQIGIVAIKDFQIADYYESYIRPPLNRFDVHNMDVHGITPDLTENAPTMDEVWREIKPFFSENIPVIAHNAHFDMSVLRLSTKAEIPNFIYADSISIVSPFVKGSKSLDNCVKEFHITLDNHHNGLSDATATAEIVCVAMKLCKVKTLWELLVKAYWVTARYFSELVPQEHFASRPKKKSVPRMVKAPEYTPQCECDPNNPLYGKCIVFTGALSFEREAAYQIAVNCGAIVRSAVSRKTNYLVVGTQDIDLVGSDGLSSKQENALRINEEGKAHIEIIDEAAFMALAGKGN